MSNWDHDYKPPEDRLGRYTPGARVNPDATPSSGRVDAAEPRSWSGDAAQPQSSGEADVTHYGEFVGGGSDQVGGGFGGASVGGYGQQGLGAQWGGAGFGPLTQGANYSSGRAGFGPAGFAPYPEGSASAGVRHGPSADPRRDAYERPSPTPLFGSPKDAAAPREFSGSAHDHHEPHYRHWRDARLAAHDQAYVRWRDEQARRYDEDYRTWRNSHHTGFTQAFEGWRDQRTTASAAPAPSGLGDPAVVHGANPTLADIADGGTGAPRHKPDHEHRPEHDRRDEAERLEESN